MKNRQKIVIVDYGIGNLRSVEKMLLKLDVTPKISNKKSDILGADKIILPGVGAFPVAMKNLQDLDLVEPLRLVVKEKGRPFLGICLGMQLLAKESLEGVKTDGLGWLNAKVKPFEKSKLLRVPHMGWDNIDMLGNCLIFKDFRGRPTFYFTHSYNMQCDDIDSVIGTCDYGEKFVAVVQKDNIIGTQFHPEKSQTHGRILMENFISWGV